MILTGTEIEKAMDNGSIVISPFNKSQLNPNSYNIRLSPKLLVHKKGHVLSMKEPPVTEELIIGEDGLLLEPGILYLGATEEYTESKEHFPCLSGRSSIGRYGISIHATAGFGDVGFRGNWTLEIFVIEPVIVFPHVEIGQLYYFTTLGEAVAYDGKYQGNRDPQPSGLYKELI